MSIENVSSERIINSVSNQINEQLNLILIFFHFETLPLEIITFAEHLLTRRSQQNSVFILSHITAWNIHERWIGRYQTDINQIA